MAETFSSGDAQYLPIYGGGGTTDSNSPYASLLYLLRSHSPTSSELFSYIGLFVSVGTLLFLLGIAVTASAIGFIVFFPLIIISSPIWLPVFVVVGVFLSVAGFLVGTLALGSWTYRYYRGMHPVGCRGQAGHALRLGPGRRGRDRLDTHGADPRGPPAPKGRRGV